MGGPTERGAPPAATPRPGGAYPIIVAAFCALLLISNISAVKLISLGPLIFDGGALLFPITYIFGDVLAEVWGLKAATRAIGLGFAMGALAALAFWLVQVAPPAADWPHQAAFEAILGFVPRIVAASLAGYLVGQVLNAWVLVRVKAAMQGRAMWVRLVTSTLVGEAADTLVFCFIAFYGVVTGGEFANYAVTGYLYKCGIEVVLLPLTYAVIRTVRRRESAASPRAR